MGGPFLLSLTLCWRLLMVLGFEVASVFVLVILFSFRFCFRLCFRFFLWSKARTGDQEARRGLRTGDPRALDHVLAVAVRFVLFLFWFLLLLLFHAVGHWSSEFGRRAHVPPRRRAWHVAILARAILGSAFFVIRPGHPCRPPRIASCWSGLFELGSHRA